VIKAFDRLLTDDDRLPFGELAVLEEMVTRPQLEALLVRQADRRRIDRNVKIGTLLVREGYLSKRQGKRILKIQKDSGPIEGYQLLEHLGSGGMGSVFRALQESTDRELAVKILPPRATHDSRYRTRFLREAKLLKELDHPNLVKCFAQGESNDHLFYAMEFVPGKTGRALLKERGALPEETIRSYLRQTLLAMEHYWDSRIVHRDIKPENIMFTPEGQVKLTDLGLSRQLDDGVHITRVGKTLGTPLYISPELAQGSQDIDITSDLYSLGASYYHMACGVPPFLAQSQAELLKMHVEDRPVLPRIKNPMLSGGMELILLCLLEKRRENRFQSPREVLDALDRLEAGELPIRSRPRRSTPPNAHSTLNFSSAPRRRQGRSGSGRTSGFSSSATRAGWTPPRRSSLKGQFAPLLAVFGFGALFSLGVILGSNTPATATAGQPAHAAVASGSRVGVLSAQAFDALAASDPSAAALAAVAYGRAHSDDLSEWCRRLEEAAGHLPPGHERDRVEETLAMARRDVDAAGVVAFENLREDLIELVEAGRLDDATAKLREFPRACLSTPALREGYEELERELMAEADGR
jgi:serine/threonine protein kinase